MGQLLLSEHFLSENKKKKLMSLKIFCSYSITLICNAIKIILSDKNSLNLQCKVIYLLKDFDVYFLQIFAEYCVPFLFFSSLSRVNRCDRT